MGIELSELCESSGPSEPVAQDGAAPVNSDSGHDRQDEAGMGDESVATDWDVIEELKGSPSSEVPLRITTSASGSAATKRGPPADDNVWDMKVEISHEASLRVEQIQRQIALLQGEMRRILPAETEDA